MINKLSQLARRFAQQLAPNSNVAPSTAPAKQMAPQMPKPNTPADAVAVTDKFNTPTPVFSATDRANLAQGKYFLIPVALLNAALGSDQFTSQQPGVVKEVSTYLQVQLPETLFNASGAAITDKNKIEAVQKALQKAGYPVGNTGADSVWGPNSKNALLKFQLANQVPATATLNVPTAQLLDLPFYG